MRKVFLYLYPIEEYTRIFLCPDRYYKYNNLEHPFIVLNNTIDKRYREKGYEIIYAMYPDKTIHGIEPKETDKIIYTDITFQCASGYYKDGSAKPIEEIVYPNEEYLVSQVGLADELIIGGYHFSDCVKRVAEKALDMGINTIVDLDLTDLFFSLYSKKEYFNIEKYDLERYKEYRLSRCFTNYQKENFENHFKELYKSPVYGFYKEEEKKLI
mgnify:CR=1 FL=1